MRSSRRLVAFANDPIWQYLEKGEIKPRYYNPCDFFDEVHLVTPANEEIDSSRVRELAGHASLTIHPLGAPGVLRLPVFLRRAAALVKRIGADLVRGHGMLLGGLPAVWAARANNLPVALSLHSNEDTDLRALVRQRLLPVSTRTLRRLLWLRLFERYILSKADKIICRYEAIRSYALAHGARDRDTEVIYNWIDVDRFRPRPATPNGRTIRVISVNRQDPEKDPSILIRAVRALNVELVLIGNGTLHEQLKQIARDEGIADRVVFIPSASHSEIHQHYQSADICAINIAMAGISMGTMEAMASGLPVVCARTQWAERPEVVGDVAVMVDPTVEGLSEGIRTLAADPALRARLGGLGRERILQIRGDAMERREAELYEQMLKGRRSPCL
jgi:glycosyltransferase involved in cell wall biosynthesis